MSIKFKHPFCFLLAGPTSSGKSTFIKKFLHERDDLIDSYIHEVIYCLPEDQLVDESIPYTQLHRGIPDINMFKDLKPRLVIIDDLMSEIDSNVVQLFSRGSHHFNISVMFVLQNIFNQTKGTRDISLNSHYIVLFKNPRDKQQINVLARQMCPENTRYITESYKEATDKPYGYLLFDLRQTTPELYRLRTNIFTSDHPRNIVYVPTNYKK